MLLGMTFLIYLGNSKSKLIGQSVPELDLQPLLYTDSELSLESLRGKIVAIHFWGPWCPPCRVEYPEIIALQKEYKNSAEVAIVSISCGSRSPEDLHQLRQDTQKMVSETAQDLPIYCDPAEYSRGQIFGLLSEFAYPTTVLLDERGNIFDFWIGALRPGELKREIVKALSQRKTDA
jgi:cytochrome c-type biogenesis protein